MSGFDYIKQAQAATAPGARRKPEPYHRPTKAEIEKQIADGLAALDAYLSEREFDGQTPIEHTAASQAAEERTDAILARAATNGGLIAGGTKIRGTLVPLNTNSGPLAPPSANPQPSNGWAPDPNDPTLLTRKVTREDGTTIEQAWRPTQNKWSSK